MSQRLTSTLREFIIDSIDSLETLETLLLFKKTSEREWSIEELAQELKMNKPWVLRQIGNLTAKGFIEPGVRPETYRLSLKDLVAQKNIGLLAKAYGENRLAVIHLISERFIAIRAFASAFKMRKDDDHDR